MEEREKGEANGERSVRERDDGESRQEERREKEQEREKEGGTRERQM